MGNKTISVIVCDEHPIVRFGLMQIFECDAGISILADTSCCCELSASVERFNPDIVILDARNNYYQDAIIHLQELQKPPKIIIYTSQDNETFIVDAIEQGVSGYLLKKADYRELIKAVYVVYKGGTFLDMEVASKLTSHIRIGNKAETGEHLSKREVEILKLVAFGNSNRDISKSLLISETTVKFHVSSILAKLQVRNRTQAALVATQRGMV